MLRRPIQLAVASAPRARWLLGELHLATSGIERRARRFVAQLADRARSGDESPGALVVALRTHEFAAGRTVVVEGWVLSESEALVAAALALDARKDA